MLLAALATGGDPVQIADELGDAGGGGLKKLVTESINEYFAPIRARRAELASDPGHLRDVLRQGNERANQVAEQTLSEVRAATQDIRPLQILLLNLMPKKISK